MKLSSLIRSHTISVKEIYLKKYTQDSIFSEVFFNIPLEPNDTCPIIDSAIEYNNVQINQLKVLETTCESYLKYSPIEHKKCKCAHILKENLIQLSFLRDSVIDAQDDLCEINDYLDLLRNQCVQKRSYGKKIKDLLWACLDKKITLLELNDLFIKNKLINSDSVNEQIIESVFNKIDIDYQFNDSPCKEKCDNYVQNSNLEDIFNHSITIEYSPYINLSFKNEQAISDWANCIGKLIHNAHSIKLKDPDITTFLALYNDKQRSLFSNHKYIQNEVTPLLMTKDIDDLWKSTENLILTKKIKILQDETNLIIKEFRSVNLDKDYEILSTEMAIFLEKVRLFKRKLNDFLTSSLDNQNIESNLSITEIIKNLLLKINTIDDFIFKNGPQIFSIEE